MHLQGISIEVPSPGARRATGEGSTHGWQIPQRFSARQKTEVVLRLLRGEARDLLSRELGAPAARLTIWREAFLDACLFDAFSGPWTPSSTFYKLREIERNALCFSDNAGASAPEIQ